MSKKLLGTLRFLIWCLVIQKQNINCKHRTVQLRWTSGSVCPISAKAWTPKVGRPDPHTAASEDLQEGITAAPLGNLYQEWLCHSQSTSSCSHETCFGLCHGVVREHVNYFSLRKVQVRRAQEHTVNSSHSWNSSFKDLDRCKVN